jgi:hypothetical protein
MTVIELQTMETIKNSLPKIVNELKRIADALEAKKENDNDND